MPTTRRTREIDASPDVVWRRVGDLHHLPRWWPKLSRVEGVDAEAFTMVFQTDKGRPVRADQRILELDAERRVVRWGLTVAGSPFERILKAAETEVRVEPGAQDGSRVTIELEQSLRGLALFGGFLVRRAARDQLDRALDGLEAAVAR